MHKPDAKAAVWHGFVNTKRKNTKSRRFKKYLSQIKEGKAILHKSEVVDNPDPKIDEDFKGYPNSPAKENVINPKTSTEQKLRISGV